MFTLTKIRTEEKIRNVICRPDEKTGRSAAAAHCF